KMLAGREYQQLQTALKLVEEKVGMEWRQALEAASSGGLHIGFDLPTQGIVALIQSADEPTALKARDAILAVARAQAAANGRADPVKTDELRGVTIHEIGKAYLAVLDRWLLVSNKNRSEEHTSELQSRFD